MNIAVIGSGAIALATGKGLIKHNNEITFVDSSIDNINKLNSSGFKAILAHDYTAITTSITFICVPISNSDGSVKLTQFISVIEQFASRLRTHKNYHVLTIRSTILPGTARNVVIPLIEKISGKKAGKDFGVVFMPEYMRENSAKQDYSRPWFILIGELDKKSGNIVEKLYHKFDAPIERVSLEEAEFQKYVHNSFNAVKIAFFNEIRVVANEEGWDIDAILNATAESSEGIWNPLYGMKNLGAFYGPALVNDTKALVRWGDDKNYNFGIIRSVIAENIRHEKILSRDIAALTEKVAKVHD